MSLSDLLGSMNFNNPEFLGLLQGLGQASMPSRLPVPFGAALGMGLQGMQQGKQLGMQNELTQQQIATGNLGLNQSLAAINYYRSRNNLPPIDMASLSKPTAATSAKGFSTTSPLPTTPTDAVATPSPTPLPDPMAVAPPSADAAPAAPQHVAFPVSGPISSGFGERTLRGSSEFHNGVDFAVPTGTPVAAAADGVVVGAGTDPASGNFVRIQHADGSTTGYGHLSKVNVKLGQQVTQGDPIALSGATGNATGPNLHFTVRDANGQPVDPRTATFGAPAAAAAQGAVPAASASPVAPQDAQSASPLPQAQPFDPAAGLDQIGLFNPAAAMQAELKLREPQQIREGGASIVYDPATHQMRQVFYQPHLPMASTMDANGHVVPLQGGATAIATAEAAKTAGEKAATLKYQPQIAAGVAAAETAVKNRLTTMQVYNNQTQQMEFRTPQEVLENAGQYRPVLDQNGNPTGGPPGHGTPAPQGAPAFKTVTGVAIPAPPAMNRNPLAAGPSEADKAQAGAGAELVKNWTEGVPQAVQGEQRFLAMADALKQIQSGAWTQNKADISAHLLAAGFDPKLVNNILQAPPAQAQIIIKNNFGAAMNSMKGITNRVTQNEIFAAQKNLSNPNLQPEANAAIIAQGVGIARYNQAIANDWQTARQAGWSDPVQFQSWWMQQPGNSLKSFIGKAAQEIGPLKGAESPSQPAPGRGGVSAATPARKLNAKNPDADYAMLPRGAHFIGPDGKERVKP